MLHREGERSVLESLDDGLAADKDIACRIDSGRITRDSRCETDGTRLSESIVEARSVL